MTLRRRVFYRSGRREEDETELERGQCDGSIVLFLMGRGVPRAQEGPHHHQDDGKGPHRDDDDDDQDVAIAGASDTRFI